MADRNSGPEDISRHDGFRAWLAMNDYLVDEDFLVFDVDGMPDDPFTQEGLRVAETEALRRFADSATALRPVMVTAGAFVYHIRAEDLNQT